jgi:hypothetical protein
MDTAGMDGVVSVDGFKSDVLGRGSMRKGSRN